MYKPQRSKPMLVGFGGHVHFTCRSKLHTDLGIFCSCRNSWHFAVTMINTAIDIVYRASMVQWKWWVLVHSRPIFPYIVNHKICSFSSWQFFLKKILKFLDFYSLQRKSIVIFSYVSLSVGNPNAYLKYIKDTWLYWMNGINFIINIQ